MILPEGNVLISFSGGRTSGYMLHRIVWEANEGLPSTCKVLFTNTGRDAGGHWTLCEMWKTFGCGYNVVRI